MTDPWEHPETRKWSERVVTELVPRLQSSRATVSLVTATAVDVKFAVEIGLSIMMDKPIIAVVTPGAQVPEKLVKVADAIVEGDLKDPGFKRRLNEAIHKVLGE